MGRVGRRGQNSGGLCLGGEGGALSGGGQKIAREAARGCCTVQTLPGGKPSITTGPEAGVLGSAPPPPPSLALGGPSCHSGTGAGEMCPGPSRPHTTAGGKVELMSPQPEPALAAAVGIAQTRL